MSLIRKTTILLISLGLNTLVFAESFENYLNNANLPKNISQEIEKQEKCRIDSSLIGCELFVFMKKYEKEDFQWNKDVEDCFAKGQNCKNISIKEMARSIKCMEENTSEGRIKNIKAFESCPTKLHPREERSCNIITCMSTSDVGSQDYKNICKSETLKKYRNYSDVGKEFFNNIFSYQVVVSNDNETTIKYLGLDSTLERRRKELKVCPDLGSPSTIAYKNFQIEQILKNDEVNLKTNWTGEISSKPQNLKPSNWYKRKNRNESLRY